MCAKLPAAIVVQKKFMEWYWAIVIRQLLEGILGLVGQH